ncbi:MAG: SufS family cysteine desulfurase [Candidatus Diapherotrites archaeon]|uniref:Cysteine desulfurase n=1 Tax=Candidatus Iainarchaeum sp. TaxID=3101447 RepID=A0A8T4L7Y1_9ARCH|nr:SufS family cysteine desulfurase [Candidatus Diapherotrites archaeon]
MNTTDIRRDFPVLERKINGKHLVYLDNAATSLKPKQVSDAMHRYYIEMPANVHRGLHRLSEQASQIYEESHKTVAKFINSSETEIAYMQNATAAINAVMYSLLESGKLDHKEIVISRAEHHANLVPWQFAAKKAHATLKFVDLNPDYTLNMDDLEQKISDQTAIVAMAHITNTVAAINDVAKIAKISHDHGALCLVDGAQSVPHLPIDVKKIDCDFLAFSAHKMLGPTGIGVLYGKEKQLDAMEPFLYGGSMIHSVTLETSTWNKLPDKFEAGTPPIGEAFGFQAAVQYLKKIGMTEVREHEKQLVGYALKKMSAIDGLRIYGPKDPKKQGGIILFDYPRLGCHELALAMDEANNIAIRSGMHCAEPIVSSINPNGLCRASFYIYNTEEEIDLLATTLEELLGAFS